jgi:hypothetical protein
MLGFVACEVERIRFVLLVLLKPFGFLLSNPGFFAEVLLLPPAELGFAEYGLLLPCAAVFLFAGLFVQTLSWCPRFWQ